MAATTSDAISSIATMVVFSLSKANIVGREPRRKPKKLRDLETFLNPSETRNRRLMGVLPTLSLTLTGKTTNSSWSSLHSEKSTNRPARCQNKRRITLPMCPIWMKDAIGSFLMRPTSMCSSGTLAASQPASQQNLSRCTRWAPRANVDISVISVAAGKQRVLRDDIGRQSACKCLQSVRARCDLFPQYSQLRWKNANQQANCGDSTARSENFYIFNNGISCLATKVTVTDNAVEVIGLAGNQWRSDDPLACACREVRLTSSVCVGASYRDRGRLR